MHTPFVVKLLIVLALLAVVISLGIGLVRLIQDRSQSNRTVKALTVRIAISLVLFLLLVVGFLTGFIAPHGVTP